MGHQQSPTECSGVQGRLEGGQEREEDRREGRTGEEKRKEEREAVGERWRRSWEQHTLAEH